MPRRSHLIPDSPVIDQIAQSQSLEPCHHVPMSKDHSPLDIGALFDGLGPQRSDCWRLVESMAEAFWGPIRSDHGVQDSQLDEAESRLGIALPPALREGYRLLGHHPNMSAQDSLLRPAELELHGPDLVRFRVENQACADWACSIGQEDPPVHIRSATGIWELDAGSVSQFFVHMVLSEILMTARFYDNGPADDDRIERLEVAFHQLPVAPFVFWPGPDLPPRRFFGGLGILIAEDAETWIWAAALTQDLLNQTRRELPGEWNLLSDTPN